MNLAIHLVAVRHPETGQFFAFGGPREIYDGKLYACVDQYYPKQSLDYLLCRGNNFESLWWEDCFKEPKMDAKKMKSCSDSPEGDTLFAEKVKLSEELKITASPIFLLNNLEIFGLPGKATDDEIKNLLESVLK